MAIDLQRLANVLEASLDPRQNKQAELAIRQEEKKSNFSLSLLQIVASQAFGDTTRLASALYFKNFVKRNWVDEDGQHQLPESEVVAIKSELIGLMISVPSNIQSQLGDAISVIADSDFWERWDTLVADLVSRLNLDNAQTNIGVLQVAHSIFKRWRPLYRSDGLFTEINHVLNKFGAPFLGLLENTDRLIEQSSSDEGKLRPLFNSFNLMIKLLYDLSVQELPPIFEENLSAISTLLHKYLVYNNSLLETQDDSESGILEHVKAGIFEVLELWIQKYEEDFGRYVTEYVGSSWNLLTTIGSQTKYDILVSRALHFLTAVTRSTEHAQAFNEEGTLSQVIERVILPNLTLRESDIELFEDEPIEFIRRDLEGSDSDTRRRAATDFLRGLMAKFENLVAGVVLKYIEHYLTAYKQSPTENWKMKDTAVYLYSAIAAKGAVTASQGVTATHAFANVVEFFQQNIASDLVAEINVHSILKVDAIKYLYIFRSQITAAQWQDAYPLLVKQLGSPEYVIYTYAAIALERAMALSSTSKQPVLGRAEVEGLAGQLLQHLFGLIESSEDPAKLQENEFLMRCIMRVLILIRDGVTPHVDSILPHFLKITQISSQNPSNPRFNYYLFEAIGALVRFAAPSQPQQLENAFYTPFATVLQTDIQEFMPYVFQLFAALLEANPTETLTSYYQSLIGPLMNPSLWASKGNVPALVRLLTAIIPRGHGYIIENNQLETLLGIFQQLVATKTNEVYGLELLDGIITYFPKSSTDKYWEPFFKSFLRGFRTLRRKALLLDLSGSIILSRRKMIKALEATFFIERTEEIQAGVFTPLYLTIILPDTQKLARPLDRKTAVISLAKTLVNSKAFAERYKKGWAYTCIALLKLLESPPVPPVSDDTITEQDPDDMSFGVGFTQLVTIKKPPRDAWPEIADVRVWVGQQLRAGDASQGGKISNFASERLSAEVLPDFQKAYGASG